MPDLVLAAYRAASQIVRFFQIIFGRGGTCGKG
jgi:hypothetical protein